MMSEGWEKPLRPALPLLRFPLQAVAAASRLAPVARVNGITRAARQKFFLSVQYPAGVSKEDGLRTLQFSGKRSLGPLTVCETMIEGTKISLLYLQLKMVCTPINPFQFGLGQSKPAGCIAVVAGSDLQSRLRLTMESTLGSEEDKHCLSTVISSDLRSRLSWGLASSLKVRENLVIFSRYNDDAYVGQRVLFQVVSKVDERNTVSPVCSATLGSVTQGGITWTRSFSQQRGAGKESVQLKALYSSTGSYMVSVKAQVGELES